jgi:hypothetical protein
MVVGAAVPTSTPVTPLGSSSCERPGVNQGAGRPRGRTPFAANDGLSRLGPRPLEGGAKGG